MVSLDLYTQNIPLTQKAKFWSNYVSSLKGENVPSEVLAAVGQFISVLRLSIIVMDRISLIIMQATRISEPMIQISETGTPPSLRLCPTTTLN